MDERSGEQWLAKIRLLYDGLLEDGLLTKANPRKYVSFIETIAKIHDSITKAQKESTEHLMAGLQKLRDAEDNVKVLQIEAAQQQELLSKKQMDQDAQMTLITQKIGRALERRREVDDLKKVAAKDEDIALSKKLTVEEELQAVNPVLEAAKNAVGNISKEHINEIKSLRAPHQGILDVMIAIFTLLGFLFLIHLI